MKNDDYTYRLPAKLATRAVNVLLVGAGGTGSRILEKLAMLHRAMVAKGHPGGLNVTVQDDDIVSPSNIGRQAFYPSDIGCPKAAVLVNRVNMHLPGVSWQCDLTKVTTSSNLNGYDIVIGAVDNRRARLGILRSLENRLDSGVLWLDTGNRANDGQVILGQVPSRKRVTDKKNRLPHAAEFYPEIIDPASEADDDTPSCSLAEALEKQNLLINPVVSDVAANLLWKLFSEGQLKVQGAFINLDSLTVTPLRIDPEVWKRFGITKTGRRTKVVRPSRAKKEAVAA